jgi:lysophospholipase L1-like esterase
VPVEDGPSSAPMKTAAAPDAPTQCLAGWRNLLVNLALVAASVLMALMFAEGILFRFILIPSDVPANVYHDGLVRLRPGDRGVWRVGDDVAGEYRINAHGWNSGHVSYDAAPPAGALRIAIIGDSFVEALQVPYDASLAEQLEGMAGGRVQVYRFGISGAPLSQYLAMARHVAQTYRPDVMLLQLVHNDFDESYTAVAGRYTSSFLKLCMQGDQVAGEIPPAPYQADWRDWLRQTATLRYLYYRRKLDPKALLVPFMRGPPPAYQANVALDTLASQRSAMTNIADYVFAQFRALSLQYGFTPVLIMDGDRRAIAAGLDSAPLYRGGALWLNAMASRMAAKHGIRFIDLHPVFEADWRAHRQPLNFISDNHWNESAHQIAAEALAAYLAAQP